MNDTEDKKGKKCDRKKRRKIVEDIFCLKKISVAKNLRHQKMRFNYHFVDATKRVKSDRKEKNNVLYEVSKHT